VPPFSDTNSLLTDDPESQATHGDNIEIPGGIMISRDKKLEYLKTELDMSRLNKIHQHLWWAGRVTKPRALHRQKALQREIVVAEQTDLHLVWWENYIFVKPLPRFLLHHGFFVENLCSRHHFLLYASACGLLLSYTDLIRHESDFRIALELGLLPRETKWTQWMAFAMDVRSNVDKARGGINDRYIYGELRRRRLNLLYRLVCGRWVDGYHYVPTEYNRWIQQNFAWLLLVFAYATVILSAMQVILATDQGQSVRALRNSSYGISVAILIAVAATVVVVGAASFVIIAYNIAKARRYDQRMKAQRGLTPGGQCSFDSR
jgi:hypothetical protein